MLIPFMARSHEKIHIMSLSSGLGHKMHQINVGDNVEVDGYNCDDNNNSNNDTRFYIYSMAYTLKFF